MKSEKPNSAVQPVAGILPVALITFAAAAHMLGISLRQFRRLVDAGKIAVVRIGTRSPRIQLSQVRAYIDSVTVTLGSPSSHE